MYQTVNATSSGLKLLIATSTVAATSSAALLKDEPTGGYSITGGDAAAIGYIPSATTTKATGNLLGPNEGIAFWVEGKTFAEGFSASCGASFLKP